MTHIESILEECEPSHISSCGDKIFFWNDIVIKKFNKLNSISKTHYNREKSIREKINHLHILPIKSYSDTSLFLTMPNAGKTLSEIFLFDNFSYDSLLSIAYQSSIALQNLHQHQYIHRDVAPKNIFIDYNGHAVLGDFGLSEHKNIASKERTIVGTSGFISPEAMQGYYHFTSDIYGLTKSLLYVFCLAHDIYMQEQFADDEKFIPIVEDLPLKRRFKSLLLSGLETSPYNRPCAQNFANELQKCA